MPYLETEAQPFTNLLSKIAYMVKETTTKHLGSLIISAGLKNILSIVAKTPLGERIGEGTAEVANEIFRRLAASPALRDRLKYYPIYPGFIAVYSNAQLIKVIPLQFEARITSDSRSSSWEQKDYGISDINTYQKTALRAISLETTYATTDPFVYSSAFVEQRIRELQSLLYASFGSSSEATVTQSSSDLGVRTLTAPPIVALFIGEKFMRARIPRLYYNSETNRLDIDDVKTKITFPSTNRFLSTLGKPLTELLRFLVSREPIYWRVESVNVSWEEAPVNVNLYEAGANIITAGSSRLPMFQKVIMELKEHRSANTYETREDVDSYVVLNNLLSRYLV
jgi:hypothetical protein